MGFEPTTPTSSIDFPMSKTFTDLRFSWVNHEEQLDSKKLQLIVKPRLMKSRAAEKSSVVWHLDTAHYTAGAVRCDI